MPDKHQEFHLRAARIAEDNAKESDPRDANDYFRMYFNHCRAADLVSRNLQCGFYNCPPPEFQND